MMFWIVSGGVTLLVMAALILAMRRDAVTRGAAETDLQVYKDQLREVDRDVARGVLSGEEAEQVRLEVSRRLLEADRSGRAAGQSTPQAARFAGGAVVALIVGGAVFLYDRVGAPGYPDLSLADRIAGAETYRQTRPDQATAEAERGVPDTGGAIEADERFAGLMDRLRSTVADRPDDPRGLQLLAVNEARLGNFRAAYEAQDRLVAVRGDAVEAQDLVNLATYLVAAAGGYVSPEAEAALGRALQIDPRHPEGRYLWGLLAAQIGRPDVAFRMWRPLIETPGPETPWRRVIRENIGTVAALAGEQGYEPPPAAPPLAPPPGPSREQVEAADDMAAEDRQAMIEGMVGRLAGRLADEGGPAEDWARLIQAYGVLGRGEDAATIWAEAQTLFQGEDLALLRRAAEAAGVATGDAP